MEQQNNVAKGIALIIFGAFCFAVMSALGKSLMEYYHPMQVVFFRSLGALLITFIFIRPALKGFAKTKRKGAFVLRGFVSQMAVTFWFLAISTATLPEITAISFSTPIFAALIAWLLLGERVTMLRWLGLFIGLMGIIVIIHPDMSKWQEGYAYALGASMCWAFVASAIKSLTKTESAETIIFVLMFMMTIMSLPGAIIYWQPVQPATLLTISLACIATVLWQIAMSSAYKFGSVTDIQPFEYSRLVFASMIAVIFFAEPLQLQTILGSVIVLASGFIGLKRKDKFKSAPQPE